MPCVGRSLRIVPVHILLQFGTVQTVATRTQVTMPTQDISMSRARILLSDTDESSYLPLLRIPIPCQRHTSQHMEITTSAVRRDSACDSCSILKLRLHSLRSKYPLQLRSYAANTVGREATGHGNPRTKESLPI